MNSLGRRGEVEKEKDPVDLFPTEPTESPLVAMRPWTPGPRNSSAHLER